MQPIYKILISIVVGLFSATSVMGQTDQPRVVTDPFHNLTIDAVTATYDAETGLVLTLSITIPDGCEPLLEAAQDFGDEPNVWVFDIRRNAVPRDTPCSSEALTTSLDITIEPEFYTQMIETPNYNEIYLLFNDSVYYRLSVMINEQKEGDTVTTVRILGNLQLMERRDLLIRSAEVQAASPTSSENMLVVLAGSSDGCRAQSITRIRVDDTTLNVSIFRLLEVGAVCPAVMRPASEIRIPLLAADQNDIPITGVYQIVVNDYPVFEYDFGSGDTSTEGAAPIGQFNVAVDSAEVLIRESMPPQVSIVVRGNLPDGCNVAMKTTQMQDGNTITIRLYRELPPDVMCTMVITPYEQTIDLGTLQLGDYTVIINGYEVKFTL